MVEKQRRQRAATPGGRVTTDVQVNGAGAVPELFVDFDPVRAKLCGRPPPTSPRHCRLLSWLFRRFRTRPHSKAWRVGRVAKPSDFSRSSINPAEFPEEVFDNYSLPAFEEGRMPKAELGSAIMSNKPYDTLVTGTSGNHQRIRQKCVPEMKTDIPPPKLVETFTTIAKPMFDQIKRNIDQSRTLAGAGLTHQNHGESVVWPRS